MSKEQTRQEKNEIVIKGLMDLIDTLKTLKKVSPELFYAVIGNACNEG